MGRILLFVVLIAALYIAWDRGMFGNRAAGVGPAQSLGTTIDQGVAKAGRAVARAGEKVEAAADRTAPANPPADPTPTPRN